MTMLDKFVVTGNLQSENEAKKKSSLTLLAKGLLRPTLDTRKDEM